MRPSLVFDEEADLLADMSFTAIDHNSPFKAKAPSMVDNQLFKKSQTVMPERSYSSKQASQTYNPVV
jgi:hypothetical protein